MYVTHCMCAVCLFVFYTVYVFIWPFRFLCLCFTLYSSFFKSYRSFLLFLIDIVFFLFFLIIIIILIVFFFFFFYNFIFIFLDHSKPNDASNNNANLFSIKFSDVLEIPKCTAVYEVSIW